MGALTRSERVMRGVCLVAAVMCLFSAARQPMALTWALLPAVVLLRYPLRRWTDRWPLAVAYLITGIAAGYGVEVAAILDNLPKPATDRVLLHPHPVADLILALPYYGVVAATWYLLLCRYAFSAASVALVALVYGLFTEQMGAHMAGLLSGSLQRAGAALAVGTVYIAFQLTPVLLTADRFPSDRRRAGVLAVLVAVAALWGQWALTGLITYPLFRRLLDRWFTE